MATVVPGFIPVWNTGGANRVEPPGVNKTSGWVFEQVPPSSWQNWLSFYTGEWLTWISERFTDGVDENELSIKDPAGGGARILVDADQVRFPNGIGATVLGDPAAVAAIGDSLTLLPTGRIADAFDNSVFLTINNLFGGQWSFNNTTGEVVRIDDEGLRVGSGVTGVRLDEILANQPGVRLGGLLDLVYDGPAGALRANKNGVDFLRGGRNRTDISGASLGANVIEFGSTRTNKLIVPSAAWRPRDWGAVSSPSNHVTSGNRQYQNISRLGADPSYIAYPKLPVNAFITSIDYWLEQTGVTGTITFSVNSRSVNAGTTDISIISTVNANVITDLAAYNVPVSAKFNGTPEFANDRTFFLRITNNTSDFTSIRLYAAVINYTIQELPIYHSQG